MELYKTSASDSKQVTYKTQKNDKDYEPKWDLGKTHLHKPIKKLHIT